jgi:hypothetical protein
MSNEHDKKLEELEKKFDNGVDVVKEIEEQYEYAKKKNYTNSSLKALELLVKVRGSSKPDDIEKSKEELQEDIMKCAYISGFNFWLDLGIANNYVLDYANIEESILNPVMLKEDGRREKPPTKEAINFLKDNHPYQWELQKLRKEKGKEAWEQKNYYKPEQ